MSESSDPTTSPAIIVPLANADANSDADEFPGEVEMSLVDHLEELRRRVLRSLLAVWRRRACAWCSSNRW